MVRCIIKKYDSIPPPLLVNLMHVLAQLDDEKQKCIAISKPFINCIEEIAKIADACNQVEMVWSIGQCRHVLHTFDEPSSLAMFIQ